MRAPRRLWLIPIICGALLWFGYREYSRSTHGTLRIHFIRSGGSNVVLLHSPSGKLILIDGGADATLLESLGDILPFFEKTIDLVVLTHPVANRIGSLPQTLERYRVRKILLSGTDSAYGPYNQLLRMIKEKEKEIPVLAPPLSSSLDFGDGLSITILWPTTSLRGRDVKKAQDGSLILQIHYKNRTLLLTGDMRIKESDALLASGIDLRSDILQVDHLKTPEDFIAAVSPRLAIIPTPISRHSLAMAPFLTLGIPVRSTAENGRVTLVWK